MAAAAALRAGAPAERIESSSLVSCVSASLPSTLTLVSLALSSTTMEGVEALLPPLPLRDLGSVVMVDGTVLTERVRHDEAASA